MHGAAPAGGCVGRLGQWMQFCAPSTQICQGLFWSGWFGDSVSRVAEPRLLGEFLRGGPVAAACGVAGVDPENLEPAVHVRIAFLFQEVERIARLEKQRRDARPYPALEAALLPPASCKSKLHGFGGAEGVVP